MRENATDNTIVEETGAKSEKVMWGWRGGGGWGLSKPLLQRTLSLNQNFMGNLDKLNII